MRRAPRWAAPALFLVLLAGFAAGLWGSYRAAFPGPGLYRLTGILEGRAGAHLILVRHETVPGVMEAMPAMAFAVESPDLLERAGVRPGDRVRLTVRQGGAPPVVVEIDKVP